MKHGPAVGSDLFVLNGRAEVCLIRRSDNRLWALPGGYQDLGETPAECAKREFEEETGLTTRISGLVGVFSSLRYDQVTEVNRGREVVHLLFSGVVKGGEETVSQESSEIGWFAQEALPALSDGHAERIEFAFRSLREPYLFPYFE